MKRVLITGASGFVGANLTRRFVTMGAEVHVLIPPGSDLWRLADLEGGVDIRSVDVSDATAVVEAVQAIRPQWVFNLAAHGAYSFQRDVRRMVSTNVLGTVNLLAAAMDFGFDAFVHAGSSSEYGYKGHAPRETERLEPNSEYAVTKASATLYCEYVGRSTGAPVRTLRLYSVFGPWEEPTRLMPTLVLAGLRGELPPLVRPETARDFVYTEDVVDAFILAAERPGQEPGAVYNVGRGVQTTLAELVALARRVLNVGAAPNWGSMAGRSWDTDIWVADPSAIRSSLGWVPRYDVAEGFRCMVDWLRDHPRVMEWYERKRAVPV